jgi:hypothetical protein
MEQITLTLPAAQISELRWLSHREGRPESMIIGEALASYLTQRLITRHHLSDAGSNRPGDVSDDDQYFAELAEPYR